MTIKSQITTNVGEEGTDSSGENGKCYNQFRKLNTRSSAKIELTWSKIELTFDPKFLLIFRYIREMEKFVHTVKVFFLA